jgi:hypothetical protein
MRSSRPRRTYVISLHETDEPVVVEAVQRDERARVADLDELPARIREWEDADPATDVQRADARAEEDRRP